MINVLDRTMPVNEHVLSDMKPDLALKRLQQGNNDFVKQRKKNKPTKRDINAFVKNGEKGQNPFAIVLSCVDSRIPTEIIFDQHIGDIFNARIAGNFVNKDILGSMEFAASYVKLIVVLGHTACGAVAAACSEVHPIPTKKKAVTTPEVEKTTPPSPPPSPGNLIRMVNKLPPAVAATPVDIAKIRKAGKQSKYRKDFIDEVAKTNVLHTIKNILTRSPFLKERIVAGDLMIRGAIYDVKSGEVDFMEEE